MMIVLFGIVAAAVFFGGSYYAYRIAFFSPDSNRNKTPVIEGTIYEPFKDKLVPLFRKLKARPFEEVTITSHDGLELFGRYYHTQDGAPLAIGFHGYRSSYLTDFCGGSELSLSLGQNLLLIDQRSHGRSQGKTISFGIQERRDLLGWVNYAIERFGPDVKILLYGVSMGGATVLMAPGPDLPKNVKGIIADCPYAVPEDIIVHVGKGMRFPAAFTRYASRLGARIYGGFNLNEYNAIRAARDSQVPTLIIHGEADDFVPAAMSEQVQQANPKTIRRYTFPNAGHAMSYLTDTPRYGQLVQDFMKEVLA